MPELPLVQALAELPDTPDGIANRMRALGIKGRYGSPGSCPLARYLQQSGLDHAMVGVGLASIGLQSSVGLPPAVAEFRRRFDAGVYLDLVEPQTSGVTQ